VVLILIERVDEDALELLVTSDRDTYGLVVPRGVCVLEAHGDSEAKIGRHAHGAATAGGDNGGVGEAGTSTLGEGVRYGG
jgi:hypothetical protein